MVKVSLDIITPLKKWFVEKTNIITSWSDTASDNKLASEKLVKEELDTKATITELETGLSKKIDKSSIKTSITKDLTNETVVGGKTLYDELQRLEADIPDGMTHYNITDWDTAVAGFEKKENKVSAIGTTVSSDDTYPSEKAVRAGLDLKIDISSKTTSVTNTSSDSQVPSAKAVYDLYESIPKWNVTPVESIDALPTTGLPGTIYIVPVEGGSGKNKYIEFLWNDSADEPGYEQFGGIELDISKFITKKQMTEYLANNSTLTLSDAGELSLNIADATE